MRLTVVEEGAVEQAPLGAEAVRLHKQRLLFDDRLALVRKHLPGGPTRPPVVLVHGFAQNRYTWHTSRRSFSAWLAAQGYDVYNLELRGHGNSRASDRSETFADYVSDVAALATHLPPAFWIGHSLGGGAIYGAASEAPMRGVIGLAALYKFAQVNRTIHLICKLSTQARGQRLFARTNIRTRQLGRLLARLYSISDILGYTFPISGWAPGSIEPDLLAERLERGFDWTSLQIWLDMSRWSMSGTFPFEERWRAAQAPVLVLAGDLDHLMPPADARAAYDLSRSPDRTWLLLDDYATGHHWGHLDLTLGREAPRWVWAVIRDWMQERS